MKPLAIALTFAIVVPAVPARAAPPQASEQRYRELEKATGLDLSDAWASYNRAGQSGPFAEHVGRRFSLRRNIGRGFVVAGAALVFISAFFFFFGYTGPGVRRANYAVGGTGAGLGGALLVPGAVLWGVYARRIERLEAATDDTELPPEIATRHDAMRLKNGGLGLRFAF